MPKTTVIVLHSTVKTTLPLVKGKELLSLKNVCNHLLYNSHLPFYLGDGRFLLERTNLIFLCDMNRFEASY